MEQPLDPVLGSTPGGILPGRGSVRLPGAPRLVSFTLDSSPASVSSSVKGTCVCYRVPCPHSSVSPHRAPAACGLSTLLEPRVQKPHISFLLCEVELGVLTGQRSRGAQVPRARWLGSCFSREGQGVVFGRTLSVPCLDALQGGEITRGKKHQKAGKVPTG